MAKMRKFGVFALVTVFLTATAACRGGDGGTDSSIGGGNSVSDSTVTPSGATVNIDQDVYNSLSSEYQFDTNYVKENKNKFSGTLYMARAYGDELPGWEYVYDAYEKMYPNVTIQNAEYASGNAMKSALITQMSSGTESIGLVQGNYVQDQLGQYGYNFQGGFVDKVVCTDKPHRAQDISESF